MKSATFRRLLCSVLTFGLLAGCAPAPSPTPLTVQDDARSLVRTDAPLPTPGGSADVAYGDFSAELLRRCRTQAPGDTLVSPLSVLLALGMTANGAAGETAAAFEQLFGMDIDELNALCATLLADYQTLGGSTESNLANSLWIANHVEPEQPFIAACVRDYQAELFTVDFTAPQTVDQVNSWANEQTHGLIPSIVDRFDRDTAMALINAVYLNNRWLNEFPTPTAERKLSFTAADGSVSEIPCMHNQTREEQYVTVEGASGVILPYDDGRLGFVVLLPDEDSSLDALLENWDGSALPKLLEGAEERLVSLCMPKFEAEWGGSLNDVLCAMGLGPAFDSLSADFSAMGQSPLGPLYISDVIHKTALKVNEKGTEAAAVTAVIAACEAAMPPEDLVVLVLDRPFFYGIVDLERGVPLFLGTFEQP